MLTTYKVKGIYDNKKIIQACYKYIFEKEWIDYYKINDVENMFIYDNFKRFKVSKENIINLPMNWSGEELIYSKNYSFGEFINHYFLKTGDNSKIAIPIYQRQYNWDQKLAIGLLNDILNLDSGKYHYIGGIVLFISFRDRLNNKLIDGQQRLTTCLIILRQIYNVYLIKDYKIPDILYNLFNLDQYDENAISKTFKRIDTNSDFRTFNNIIKGEQIQETTTSVFTNSIAVFNMIRNFDENNLNSFFKKIYEQLILSVTIDHISNEYTLFENLNTKSLQLSTMDLIKNFLFMHINHQIVDKHEQQLQFTFEEEIISKFKNFKNPTSKMDSFINVFLRLKEKKYEADSAFESFKETLISDFINNRNLKSFEESRKLFIDLGKYIYMYISVSDSNSFNKLEYLTYRFKDILTMLEGREIYYPLLMKILINFDYENNKTNKEITKQIRKVFFEIEKYEVRLQVSNYKGQSLSQYIDLNILKELGNGIITPDFIRKLFIGEHEDELNNRISLERFKNSLMEYDISNKIATLIGYRIENYLSNNKNLFGDDYNYIDTKYEKRTLEHIIPQKPNEEWYQDIIVWSDHELTLEEAKRWKTKFLNKLGNLMCIEGKSNSKIQNKTFNNKIYEYSKEGKILNSYQFKGYKDEFLELTGLRSFNNFYEDNIKKRTKQLTKICCDIWKDN
ncbi:DUF262 domain-containing HNH endonuclease family protein [Spiroplasma endosymbiont of Atherix ibis]|uniref:DUF262 domain-containing protein n=1 Tax=Spiroplasma endosymbiont of Atherix ibis TaxID=3066291 RepID=UPI0030D3A11C